MAVVELDHAADLVPRRHAGGWLAAFAVSVVVGQHIGSILKPFGLIGLRVEWADVVDLTVPYAVVGTAWVVLHRCAVSRRTWGWAVGGAVLFTQGHGVHLAANSIGNARGNEQPVHLWDEVVGHYLWYSGLYVLVGTLVVARPHLGSAWRWPLAALVGVTFATNGIEGGTVPLTLPVAIGCVAWGLRHSLPTLVAMAGVTLVLLLGWGTYWQGFPQFSELGWI